MPNYYHVLDGVRICNASRVDQSGSDNASVTNWETTDDFILATCIHTNSKLVEYATFKVQWSDLTDVSSYTDVTSTGEINWTASTVLNDNDILYEVSRKCSGIGDFWQNGYDNEGDNLAPDSGTYLLIEDYETEFHWALSPSGAQAGHEYGFRIWDASNNVEVGTSSATLTIAAAGPSIPICMYHYMHH